MFKKFSITLLVLIGAIGAYALSANLFPDTVSFPRIPMGTGAIGEVLGKLLGTTNIEGSDGTAQNAYTLSGMSAQNYLHNTLCTTPGDVWVGVDAGGNPICGQKWAALAFGKVTEYSGAVSVLHPDGSTSPATSNMVLNVGDIISTPSDGYATLGFNDDNSILRLDASTIVELQRGALSGNSVAEAILQDGSLWGRILTDTGVNFSAGGYVAGVRGTSISLEKVGTQVNVTIPHSRNAGSGAAGTLTCPQGTMGLSIGSALAITGGSLACPTDTPSGSIANLYTNPWVRENTKKDIIMMNIDLYKTFVGVSDPLVQKSLALAELDATIPTDLTVCQKLMDGDAVILSGSSYIDSSYGGYMLSYQSPSTITSTTPLSNASCGDIIAPANDIVKQKIMGCALENKSYWPTFDELPLSKCQDQHTLAVANFTYTGAMYSKTGSRLEVGLGAGMYPSYYPGGGVTISASGQYISFNTGILNTAINSNLAGKTVTIELSVPVGSMNNAAAAGTKFYIADLGATDKYFVIKDKNCSGGVALGQNWLCKSPTTSIANVTTATTLIIGGTTAPIIAPTQMIIGNNTPGNQPIWTTIQKITISN